MRRSLGLLVLALCAGFWSIAASASQTVPNLTDVQVVSGELEHHRLTNDLFHIDDLWMKVAPDTAFHRWLSDGVDKTVTIIVTSDPARFSDASNVRILSGRLIHQATPSDNEIVHVLFLQDSRSGSLGAVTFQTKDAATAMKLEPFDGETVSVVVIVVG